MTAPNFLYELLDHIAAIQGNTALLSTDELGQWPDEDVSIFENHKLIRKTRPTTSIECTECEEACIRPIYSEPVAGGETRLFIVCEKQSDINRIEIPASRLEQWKSCGSYFAELVSELLELRRPNNSNESTDRWEIGLMKGRKHSSHITLVKDNTLQLNIGGHSIALADVLTLENDHFIIDKKILTRFIDNPVSGGGNIESAEQRRKRIKKRVNELKTQGVRAFLKAVAEEEDISISRIKQLIQDDEATTKHPKSHW